ncbi:MAG: tetratricopeptide repeat protein [Pyrinomonadaceae bacterium]
MRISKFTHFVVAALLLATFAVTASAQVTATGKVMLKQADGTEVPLSDALVQIYRTDIKQSFKTKTNKKGEYVYAGMDYIGTYSILISAPNARPSYIGNVRLSAQPANNFTLEAGDGRVLTLEETKAAGASAGAAAKPGGASAADIAAAKKLAEEEAKKRAEIEARNVKIDERNAKLPVVFKAANEAFTAKKYDEAITLYDQGIAIDPDEAVVYRNKALALRSRGRDKYNNSLGIKDAAAKTAAREEARNDFKAATETGEKAISAFRAGTSKIAPGGAAAASGGGGGAQNSELDFLSERSESYRIALQTSAQIDTNAAAKAIQEYIAAETDPAKKTKAEASLGDALFAGGRVDESIAAYKGILASNPNNLDALFGLGIALAAEGSDEKTAQARDMLQQFATKAAATDPRKQQAEEAVVGLNEALKPKPADKSTTTKRRKT